MLHFLSKFSFEYYFSGHPANISSFCIILHTGHKKQNFNSCLEIWNILSFGMKNYILICILMNHKFKHTHTIKYPLKTF